MEANASCLMFAPATSTFMLLLVKSLWPGHGAPGAAEGMVWITRMELGCCWPVLVPLGQQSLWLLPHPRAMGLMSEQTPAGLGIGWGLEERGLAGQLASLSPPTVCSKIKSEPARCKSPRKTSPEEAGLG